MASFAAAAAATYSAYVVDAATVRCAWLCQLMAAILYVNTYPRFDRRVSRSPA